MTEHLKTLREAGFFKEYGPLSDTELLEVLREQRREEYGGIFGHGYEPEDISHLATFLSQDDKKFLDIDLEADVLNGNHVYESVLEDFARASNGHFNPVNIKEEWASDEGPIKVSFSSNGQEIVFEPEYMDDWMDGRVFEVINREMAKVSQERFVVCTGPDDAWFGQNIIHIRLTEEEKQLLKEKLGWSFPE